MSSPSASSRCAARLAAGLAAGTVAVAITACGDDSVDQDALESGMVTLAQQTADVESASCPDDVSPDEGTEFECTVTNAKGQDVPVTATITGQDGEDILFDVQTVDGVDVTK